MAPLCFIPEKSDGTPSKIVRSPTKKHSRRRRRRSDTETFDQASKTLDQFHWHTSRSLDVIFEHSESGDDEDGRSIRIERKLLSKARTYACLSSLSSSEAMDPTAHNFDSYRNFSQHANEPDEWGFFPLEDNEVNGPTEASRLSRK